MHDISDLLNEANKYHLSEVSRKERETWAAVLLEKK
jgi:hypothetical protein